MDQILLDLYDWLNVFECVWLIIKWTWLDGLKRVDIDSTEYWVSLVDGWMWVYTIKGDVGIFDFTVNEGRTTLVCLWFS